MKARSGLLPPDVLALNQRSASRHSRHAHHGRDGARETREEQEESGGLGRPLEDHASRFRLAGSIDHLNLICNAPWSTHPFYGRTYLRIGSRELAAR